MTRSLTHQPFAALVPAAYRWREPSPPGPGQRPVRLPHREEPDRRPAERHRANGAIGCAPARKRAYPDPADALATLVVKAALAAARGERGPARHYPCRYVDGGHLHLTHWAVPVPCGAAERSSLVEPPPLDPCQPWRSSG